MNLITRGHAVAGSLTVAEDLVVGGTFSAVGVVEDGTLTVENIEAAGEIVAAEVTALGVSFVVGAEDNDVINVALQVNDGHGDPVAASKALHFYLADDADGLGQRRPTRTGALPSARTGRQLRSLPIRLSGCSSARRTAISISTSRRAAPAPGIWSWCCPTARWPSAALLPLQAPKS